MMVEIEFGENKAKFDTMFELNNGKFETGLAVETVERDHRALLNRDAENQHPIGAITGLQLTLDALKMNPITNTEIDEILKGIEGNG